MKRRTIRYYLILVLTIMIILAGCGLETINSDKEYSGQLIVHFLDVGQGDSIFIQFPNGETALIDGGTRNSGEKVVKYLKELNIYFIDYLIATHPHEDHIGGLPEVIRNFEIGKVYMPNRTTNTLIFEELLKELKAKDLKISIAKGGDAIIDKTDIKFLILAPNRDDYERTNDFSIVTKIKYKNISFILTGDAEKDSEKDMLKEDFNLKADVLKLGHHGSNTSSTIDFLEAVKPDYAIISVGADNSYGHPHREVLDRMKHIDTEILRTDELGDIIFKSNGIDLNIEKNKNFIAIKEQLYIGNKNTKVFHKKDCKSLPNKENQIIFKSIDEAIDKGYRPHEKCVK